MKNCKFKIGDTVTHRQDLYGNVKSTVKSITRGFRSGDGVQWLEEDAGNLATPSHIDETGEAPVFVFEKHIETVHNQIWNDKEQRMDSVKAVGGKIVEEERLSFYSYNITVTNEDMNTLYPEHALQLAKENPSKQINL